MSEEIIEITPCPYVNGFASDNTDVSFMLKKYEQYSDFVLFEDGKPSRCFRFAAPVHPSQDRMEKASLWLMNYCQGDDVQLEDWRTYLPENRAKWEGAINGLLDLLAALPQTEEVNAIKEWAAAKAAVDALPEDAYLDPAKMDALTAAIHRKNQAEAALFCIAKGGA